MESAQCKELREGLTNYEVQTKLRSCSDEEICESLLEDPQVYLKNCATGAKGASEKIGEGLGALVFDILTTSDSRSLCVQSRRVQELFVQEFNRDLPSCLQQKPNLEETEMRDCEQLSKLLHSMLQQQVEAFKFKSRQIEKAKQDPCFQAWTNSQEAVSIHLNFSEFKKKLQALGQQAAQLRHQLTAASACYKSSELQSLMCSGGTYLVADMLIGKGKNSISKILQMAQKANPKMDDLARVANNLQEAEAREAKRKRKLKERQQRISRLSQDPEVTEAEKAIKLYKSTEGYSELGREKKLFEALPQKLGDLVVKNSGMKVKSVTSVESGEAIKAAELRLSNRIKRLEKIRKNTSIPFLIEENERMVEKARSKLDAMRRNPTNDFEIHLDLDSHPMLKALKEKWGVEVVKVDSKLLRAGHRGSFEHSGKIINISPEALLAAGGDLRLSATFYHEIHHAMVKERLRRLDSNLPTVSGFLKDNNQKSNVYRHAFYLDELSAHSLSVKLRQRGLDWTPLRFEGGGSTLKHVSDRAISAIDSIKKERSWERVRPLNDDQVMLEYGKKNYLIVDVRDYKNFTGESAEQAIRDRLDQLETYARKAVVMGKSELKKGQATQQRLFESLFGENDFP